MYGVTDTPVIGGRAAGPSQRDPRLAVEQRARDGIAGRGRASGGPRWMRSDGVRFDKPFGCATVVVTPGIDDRRCAM